MYEIALRLSEQHSSGRIELYAKKPADTWFFKLRANIENFKMDCLKYCNCYNILM